MPGQFGFEFTPDDISQASQKTHEQVSDFVPDPWWKRFLMDQMEGGGGQQRPESSSPAVSQNASLQTWTNLGKGVGKGIRMAFGGGFANGGAVQGPTMALIGEGGEEEAVLPKSKALPFSLEYLRTGKMPNPANLPRVGGHRPPPPVILANTPAMGCGGKVVPAMANGGVVDPFLNMDPFAVPDFSAAPPPAMQMPQVSQPPIAGITPPRGQQAGQVAPPMLGSPDAMKRLAELQRNRPLPKWYERPFMGNGAQLDMRPGVAAYSQAGRAVGNIIGALLPINRKANEWERNVEAAKMDATAAQAKDAATIKQQELEQRGRATDAQVAASRSTEALRNKQSAAMDAPPPRKLRVTDYTNAETGDVTRVWNDENTGDEVKREVLGGVAKPKPTATSERNPTAASLAAVAADPNATPEERAAAEKALKLLKPPKAAGGASSEVAQVALSDEDERLAQNIADGVYKPIDIPVGKDGKKKAILARAAELGYGGGGQSASDAKLGGIVETLPNELEKLRGIVRGGYRGMVAGYQSGTNREIVRLIDNIADKVGRLRSGGAINRDEEARFLRQLGTDKADLLFGSAEEAEKAIDGVLAEAQAVSGRMKKPPKAAAAGQKPNAEKAAPASGRQVRDKRTGDVRTLKPGQDVNAFTKQYPQFEAVAAKGKE